MCVFLCMYSFHIKLSDRSYQGHLYENILSNMEIVEILINNEDQVPGESKEVINQMIDKVSKIIEETTDEGQTTTEDQIDKENIEKNDDEVVPSTTPQPIEEQENVTDINTTASTSVSSSRTNTPLKQVNEDSSIIVNGAENINNKKREFDNESQQVEGKSLDNNERTDDQTKKIKIVEPTDSPTVETNLIINGTSTVEV